MRAARREAGRSDRAGAQNPAREARGRSVFCQSRGRRRAKDVGGVSCQCVVLTAAARAGDKHGHASKQTGTNKAGSGQGLASSRRVRQQSHAAVWGVVLAPSCVARDKEIDDWFAGITPGAAGGGSTALSVSQLCHRRVSQRYRIKRLFPIMCALAMCLVEGGVAYKQLCVSSERNVCLVTGSLRGLGMNMVAHHVLRLRALRSLRRRRGLGRRPGTRPAARGGSRRHGRGVGVS